MVIALDRPLTSVYWLNVNDPGFPFMALVEHTNFMPASDYSGHHLVYLGNCRRMEDPLMSATPDQLLDDYLPHLPRINADFERS